MHAAAHADTPDLFGLFPIRERAEDAKRDLCLGGGERDQHLAFVPHRQRVKPKDAGERFDLLSDR